MEKTNGVGIKRKVFLGCIVLGMILFFSSLIAVYEFSKMNDYISNVIADNVTSINSARSLLNAAEDYNLELMSGIEKDFTDLETAVDTTFTASFSDLSGKFSTREERAAADSVMYAYAAYMQVVGEAEEVWTYDQFIRRDWFYNRLQPVFMKFRNYIVKLTEVSEDALISNSQNVEDAFHRSIMPPVISLILGLVLVMLFNYYLNYYVINPVLKVKKGIIGYRKCGKKYDVAVESNDEIAELSSAVKDIIDQHRSFKDQLERK